MTLYSNEIKMIKMNAKAVWLKGLEKEMNILAGFRAIVPAAKRSASILMAASNPYRLSINGVFVCHGPARAAHNYFRVDEIDISRYVVNQQNIIAIEVAGYNINSYYVLNQPSFLLAQVMCDDHLAAMTSDSPDADFAGMRLEYRCQKTQRYSFQRTFVEDYSLYPHYDEWKKDLDLNFTRHELSDTGKKNLLPRGVPHAEFPILQPQGVIITGSVVNDNCVEPMWKTRSLTDISDILLGFREDQIEVVLTNELQKFKIKTKKPCELKMSCDAQLEIKNEEFQIIEFGKNSTGFVRSLINCPVKSKLYFIFDEILSAGDVDLKRTECANVIALDMEPGTYEFESFEPYTLKYLKILVAQGQCTLGQIELREFKGRICSDVYFKSGVPELDLLFDAAVETYRQNAIDIFMDCPSRERAGWLCDSFFMARVAYDLTGSTQIETNFLENFVLADRVPRLPEKVIPCCYPADFYDGAFIPNWPLWLILQLEEYKIRGGSSKIIEGFRSKLFGFIEFMEQYINSDGLLENLPGWVFIEWSKANDFTSGVNYPTNMLYSAALKTLGNIYQDQKLLEQSRELKRKIIEKSFNGKYFCDNSVVIDGEYTVTSNCTETCQYYAFYFDIASREEYPELWEILVQEMGPGKIVPGIHPANVFIGFYLRMELLSRYGHINQLLKELTDYFMYMVKTTGTLWEHKDESASCCHGFASHIVHILFRDFPGVGSTAGNQKGVRILSNLN